MTELAGSVRLAREVTATKFASSSGLPGAGLAVSLNPPALLPWQPAAAQVAALSAGWTTCWNTVASNGLGPGGGVTPPPSVALSAAAVSMKPLRVASSGAPAANTNGWVAEPPDTAAYSGLLAGVARSILAMTLLK